MIFHNAFTTVIFAAILLLASIIHNTVEVQSTLIHKSISRFRPIGCFYGYRMEQSSAFKNNNLQITRMIDSVDNQVFWAYEEIFSPNARNVTYVEVMCGRGDQTISTVKAQPSTPHLNKRLLFYKVIYMAKKNISPLLMQTYYRMFIYKANQGHYCYMVEDVYSNNRFNALDIKQLAQENSQVFKNMLDQLRNAILFAKSLGWYYNLKHDCVRFNSNAQVLIDCFDNTYNMNHGVDKKAMVFITQDYNRIIKLYFQHVFSEAGFSKNQLDLMTAQYVDGLLID
ncbi:hypothetical protein BDF19DRAFT_415575 [Syncephalis fuscata]|nr:hypothetical protein BDF19DRAFT_415575 [Syncephalis fuscata]